MGKLYFRRADLDDLVLTFNWANDEETRKNSFNKEPISMEEHTKWFRDKINSDSARIYILGDGDASIGILRLDIGEDELLISYSIAKEYRGLGYGGSMLLELEQLIRNDESLPGNLRAEVKHDNIASQKIFEKLHYTACKKDDRIEYFKTAGK